MFLTFAVLKRALSSCLCRSPFATCETLLLLFKCSIIAESDKATEGIPAGFRSFMGWRSRDHAEQQKQTSARLYIFQDSLLKQRQSIKPLSRELVLTLVSTQIPSLVAKGLQKQSEEGWLILSISQARPHLHNNNNNYNKASQPCSPKV